MRRLCLSVVVAALACSGVLLPSCGDEDASPTTEPQAPTIGAKDPAGATKEAASPKRKRTPVKALGRVPWFRLVDQDGQAFGWDELRGKVWIANFMFTRCPATCPLQAQRLVELGKALADHPQRDGIVFVSFSVDPAHDSPEALSRYAAQHGADARRWRFLTGERRDIWWLSAKGFHLPAGEDPTNEAMPIAHSAQFVLVDRRGLVQGYFDSQDDEGMAALRAALEPVVAEPAPEVLAPPRVPWLEARAAAQQEAATSWTTFHDFHFSNIQRHTGIDFQNRVVEDAGRHYKAVHYDHGNGIAVADVDQDGRLDVYLSNQVGSNRLYRNLGAGRFEDMTKVAGVDLLAATGVSASFADLDNDGDPDLYVTTTRDGNHLFRNDGAWKFTDVTQEAGLAYRGHSSAAVMFDYDKDGALDLYLLNMQGHDRCYRNVQGKRFEVVQGVFPRTPWGSMGVKVFDVNADGQLDLYVTDMHSDMSRVQSPEEEKRKSEMLWPEALLRSDGLSIYGNALFVRDAAGAYKEVSDAMGAETFWPWGISVADLNADGYEDVFVTGSMNYPFRYGVSTVLLNHAGKGLLDAEFVLGVEPRAPLTMPWFELDCSGADRNHPMCNGRSGFVTVDAARGSRSSVVLDLDGDGDLDVITNEFHDVPLVLLSDLTERSKAHHLQMYLTGRESNRDGLGTIVRLTAGGRTQVRVHDGQSGYLSQSSMPLYFGLGAAEAVERIVLRWPSGLEQVVEGPIPADEDLWIVEGAD